VIDQLLAQGKGLLDQAAGAYREATAYPQPICRVVVNGQDITSAIEQRLISIELTDNRGMEADQLTITLSDHDGLLAIPPRGAVVSLWLGWSDTGLVSKGSYTVDEVEHSGAPDTLSIRARSADLREGLKAKKERSWHAQTIGAVIQSIAAAYGLSPVISAALSLIELVHLDQANESDANLLSRLGEQYDAIASIKAEIAAIVWLGANVRHSFTPDAYTTALELESKLPDADDLAELAEQSDNYTGVLAWYRDAKSGEHKKLTAGDQAHPKRLMHLYAEKSSAQRAVDREWKRVQAQAS